MTINNVDWNFINTIAALCAAMVFAKGVLVLVTSIFTELCSKCTYTNSNSYEQFMAKVKPC